MGAVRREEILFLVGLLSLMLMGSFWRYLNNSSSATLISKTWCRTLRSRTGFFRIIAASSGIPGMNLESEADRSDFPGFP
jgi:hypothetical protein